MGYAVKKCADCSTMIQKHNQRCFPCHNKYKTKIVCVNGHSRTYLSTSGNCLKCQAPTGIKKFRNRQFKAYGVINQDGSPFSSVDFDREYQIQQGRCKVCGKHQTELRARLHVDHDHGTGVFRGLLCSNCNHALGFVHDDVLVLDKLKSYLGVPV